MSAPGTFGAIADQPPFLDARVRHSAQLGFRCEHTGLRWHVPRVLKLPRTIQCQASRHVAPSYPAAQVVLAILVAVPTHQLGGNGNFLPNCCVSQPPQRQQFKVWCDAENAAAGASSCQDRGALLSERASASPSGFGVRTNPHRDTALTAAGIVHNTAVHRALSQQLGVVYVRLADFDAPPRAPQISRPSSLHTEPPAFHARSQCSLWVIPGHVGKSLWRTL